MKYIGKLDISIYRCITYDIKSEDVILTSERVQHIKDNHPNDYERYFNYMSEIIKKPDYIIEANKNKHNSGVILKSFGQDDKQLKMVLRLKTSTDNPDFKNSIITFMKIDEKEWNRLIKNKKILYKAE